MKTIITIALVLLLASCKQQPKPQEATTTPNVTPQEVVNDITHQEAAPEETTDELAEEDEFEELGVTENINQIRFKDWTDADWLDNDYYRAIRQYINSWSKGEIESADLDEYKDKVSGKFIIFLAEEFIAGGLWVHIAFLDNPEYLFDVWVYSDVNENTKKVEGYSVRGFSLNDERTDLTKEQIHSIIKEHPENKLW